MKYVSIDIETTSLDRNTGQILEFAAVLDDLENQKPLEELPYFRRRVLHKEIFGEIEAIEMNAELIKEIKDLLRQPLRKDDEHESCNEQVLAMQFSSWLEKMEIRPVSRKVVIAGKNYAMFDHGFLKTVPMWSHYIQHHHRVLDPCLAFALPSDSVPPDTKTCLKRAGFEPLGSHRAHSDALDVVRLVRYTAYRNVIHFEMKQ